MGRVRVALFALLVAMVGVFWPRHVVAGHVDPKLEAQLAILPPGAEVPVIVELMAQTDPRAVASANPSSDRRAGARALVDALHDVANRHQPPIRALLNQEGARSVKAFWIFNGVAAMTTEAVIRKLAKRDDVREVRLDSRIPPPVPRPSAVSKSSFADPVWNIAQVRAPDVWAIDPAYNGAGAVVGSFDTGVDGTHFDLAPRYRGNDAISWFDPYGEHDSPYDNNGHGTHTTGTMVGGDASGASIGVAPGAQWIAAKGWDDGDNATESAFHEIFQWFMAPGGDPANAPDVVNNSWGQDPAGVCFQEFKLDVQALRAAGIAAIFASGNSGPDSGTALSPGSFSDAFSVGATDFDDVIADFSSRGPSPCDGSIKPDISAPGVGVLSTFPGGNYVEFDGTSMATPHVSGAVAILRAVKPTITLDEIESALVEGAVDLGPAGPDNDFGAGRLDVFESVRIVLGLSSLGIKATTSTALEAGTVPGAFTVTRKGDTTAAVTVTYGVGGTATPGSDYVALPGALTIPAGAASATIVVTPIDDDLAERDESVVVTLDPVTGYLISPGQATVTIVSDELLPDLVISSLAAPAGAGASGTISVTDTTRNAGAGAAVASVTRFFLSTDGLLDAGDVLLGSRTVAALGPGASDSGTVTLTIPPGIPTGIYYLIAKANADNVVVETLDVNNTTSRTLQIGADLTIASLTVPGNAGAGQALTVSDVTRNIGAGASGASTTSYYLSADPVLDASDVLMGSRAIGPLAAGASDSGSASLVIPAGTGAGLYYVFAKADAANAVSEISESNNTLYALVRVGPDLLISVLTIPSAAGAGQVITVSDTTRNIGGGTAAASTTRFYLSTNTLVDAGDIALASRAVPALAAGASDSATIGITIPAGTAAGAYYLIAMADADNVVGEVQELNNTFARALQIGADLSVASVTAPTDAGAGQVVTFTDTTKNVGAGAAGASITSYYLSTNAVLDASDVLLGSRAVPALAAGASSTGSATLTIPAGTATGLYYILAKADGADAISEVSESNNVTYALMRVGPDLIVAALTAPGAAGAGTSITVTDTTRNSGGGTAPASTTRIYLSSNGQLDAGDIPLASRAVPALAAGASDSAAISVTIPAGTAAGTYFLIASADADNAVVETQETNNTFSRTLQIGADLTVTSLTVPSDAGAGLAVTFSDTTKNIGAGAAVASVTSYYLSVNSVLDASDVLLGSRTVGALAAGASDTGSVSLAIPAGTPAGLYYVFAKADGSDAIGEVSESNNTMYALMRLGPDLVVSVFSAPATAGAGTTIAVTDTTRNSGGGAAVASTTRFYLSTNALLDAGDIPLASRAVPALAAGASDSASTSVTIPTSVASGTYYLIAAADDDNTVSETQETNNILSRTLQIGADLTITSLTVPSDAGAGQAVTFSDTTKNIGAGAAGASITSYYLSANPILDSSDVLLGSRAVAPLGSGAADSGSVTVTVPAGTATGLYYVFAKADGGDAIVEVSESNNATYALLRVGPDLLVSVFSAPGTAGAGTTISVSDTTRNVGGGTAPASTTRFYLSTNGLLDAGDVPVGSRTVPALAGGASDTASTSVTIPAGVAAGIYYLIASADADNVVPELQEVNNLLSRTIQIGPDLTIASLTVPDAGAGQVVTVTDTTRNVGGGASGASTTSYYLSANSVLDASDVLLGSRAVAPLAPGAADTGSASLTIPAGTPAGLYYVFAKADAGDAVGEVFESNNTLYALMRVGPDLVIAALTVPGTTSAGATITVTDTTRNIAAGTAPASTTRFYLSTNASLDASDVPLASRAVPVLASGASDTASTSVTIPAGTSAGTYYLIASADADNVVGEFQEGNNTFARTLQVTSP
jgi:subtilase family serine protease/subtilisin family serine protease